MAKGVASANNVPVLRYSTEGYKPKHEIFGLLDLCCDLATLFENLCPWSVWISEGTHALAKTDNTPFTIVVEELYFNDTAFGNSLAGQKIVKVFLCSDFVTRK